MKRNNKKGFTIVELVIVIAVIGILAGVMIPTFAGIIDLANGSNRDQEAKNAFTNYFSTVDFSDKTMDDINGYIEVDGWYYKVTNGQIDLKTETQTQGTPVLNP